MNGAYTAMSNGVLLPLTATETLEKQLNRDWFRMADYQDFSLSGLVRSQGEWWEGDVEVALLPGSVAELIECIQTRGAYNQQYFCSAYFHMAHLSRRIWDAKVVRARFRWTKADIVRCTLTFAALDGDQTADATGSWPAIALPYQWKETAVQLEAAGGGLTADVHMEDLEFTVDNFAHDLGDGLRITDNRAGKPQVLYNLSGIGCEGSFTRDFVDTDVWTDFLNGTVADMTLTLTRGTTLTFTIKNMVYGSFTGGIPGDNASRVSTTTPFQAGSPDGIVAPIVLS